MANILILGAGSMGTAFSFPCSDNNHTVSVVGTHLENNFIDEVKTWGKDELDLKGSLWKFTAFSDIEDNAKIRKDLLKQY